MAKQRRLQHLANAVAVVADRRTRSINPNQVLDPLLGKKCCAKPVVAGNVDDGSVKDAAKYAPIGLRAVVVWHQLLVKGLIDL